MTPGVDAPGRERIHLQYLVVLRWVALAGYALLVAWMGAGLSVPVPAWPLAVVLAVGAFTNVALHLWQRGAARVSSGAVGAVMLLDVVLLTALLYFTGGPFNPFSTFYVVNVALGAMLLTERWSGVLLAASLAAFGALFLLQGVSPSWAPALPSHAEVMSLHLHGMWVAMAVTAVSIVYFVRRVMRALARREAALAEERVKAARHERLAALTTLAAGAAHELATPLGTIAVAARELLQGPGVSTLSPEVREDLRLIREQVDRCRDILRGMSDHTGELLGEAPVTVSAPAWVREALEVLPERHRVRARLLAPEGHGVRAPARALGAALRNLVQNALDASPDDAVVELRVVVERAGLAAEVRDFGPGMNDALLGRVGEPFFTTKPPGAGMGLGVFLVRRLADELGGSLSYAPAPGGGTVARLWVPPGAPA